MQTWGGGEVGGLNFAEVATATGNGQQILLVVLEHLNSQFLQYTVTMTTTGHTVHTLNKPLSESGYN